MLSQKLVEQNIGLEEWRVNYKAGNSHNSYLLGYVRINHPEEIQHIPGIYENDFLKQLSVGELLGLIAFFMEERDQIELEHQRWNMVLLVEEVRQDEDAKTKVVQLQGVDFHTDYPGIDLVKRYKFVYPNTSGSLDPVQLVASNIV